MNFRNILIVLMTGLLLVLLGIFVWGRIGRSTVDYETVLHLEDISQFGTDMGKGNLLSIQPFMDTLDYSSGDAFYAKLDGYMAAAQAEGWLNPDTIVVLPEYIGTWLVAAEEKASVYESESLNEGVLRLVMGNLPSLLSTLPQATGNVKIVDSLFRMKADLIADIYQQTFSRLAREYGVTIVAGSVVLPQPTLVDGALILGEGDLHNVALVYRPDGTPYGDLTHKYFPTGFELLFSAAATDANPVVYETPVGKLVVLICADSWYPESYAAVADLEPDMIVVPNNKIPDGSWDETWGGYDPGPDPLDVDPADPGTITEGEALLKYTLPGRMSGTDAQTGMHTFFRGGLLELDADGHTIIVNEDDVIEATHVQGAALVNYWLR